MRPLGARAVGHELVRQAGAAEESSGGGSDGRVTLVVACRRRPSSWPARATEGVICGAVDGRASDWGKANHAQICGWWRLDSRSRIFSVRIGKLLEVRFFSFSP